MSVVSRIIAFGFALLMTACDSGPRGSFGFTLPDGDAEIGKTVYLAYQCNECHDSKAVTQLKAVEEPEISVFLGGRTTRIKTYGELVTSIINPSHRLARGYAKKMISDSGVSRMPNYNDIMTVSELIDVVAFVQSSYVLQPFEPTIYPPYHYYDR